MLGNSLRRPALAALYRPQRTVLAEQEDLIPAHAEDLTCYILRSIAHQIGCHGRDLLRSHLLDLLDARLLCLGLRGDRADQPAPGERRNAVRPHVEAAHVECDRFRQADDAELGGGIIRLPEIADK